jgi:predicted permease
VTSAYFEILGAAPALGRTFRSVAADAPAAVISHGLWQGQFARAPDVLGRTVRLDARPFEIVGVMPRGFKGLDTDAVDGWIPLTAAPESCSLTGESLLGSSRGSWLGTIGRLRDDATLEQAAAELEALLPAEERFDRTLESSPSRLVTPVAQTRRERLSRDNRLAWWLAGGAVVVLLIACANVAGLLSMRAVDRRREMAVRLQLGAGRRRLLRQLAAEHLVLALACGLAALGVAAWLGAVLARFFPYGAPDLASPRVFLAAAGVSLMAGLLSGLPLARQASGIDGTALTRTARMASRDSAAFRAALLVAQVALALVLAVGAGLFVRSVSNTRQNMGIDVDRIVVAAVDLVRGGYRGDAEITTAFERMAELLRRQPDIEAVALSSGSLLGAGGFSSQFLLRPSRDSRSGAGRTMQFVSPDYFRTLGTDVQSGRAFSDADVAGSEPVIIVDRILASEVWPGRDPVGECAFTGTTCLRVVGVTEPRRSSAALRARGEMFRPHSQAGGHFRPQMLVVRPRGAPEAAVGGIAAVIRSAVNDLPFVNVRPLEDLSDEQTRSWRLGRLMFGAFGVVAMAMAAIGLYAVLVFHARQRTAEIGVRLALGATRADILRLVMRQGLTLVAAGWALGAVTAFTLADRIQGLLFDVSATDLATFVVASAAILAAGIAGCLVPAARAARVDPVVALRTE